MARKAQAMKTCTKSGEEFPATSEFFYRDKSQKDGLSPWSKAAERAYNKAYRAGLKKANAPKKGAIEDDKGIKVFETTMKSERVVRGTHKANRSNAPKIVATATTTTRTRTKKSA